MHFTTMKTNKYNVEPNRAVKALNDAVLRLYCCEDLSVLGKLGNGFYANVYLVCHTPLNLKMAMKLSNEGNIQRKEIELLCSLKHENVQKLHGACIVGGRLACLTEYANGGSLVDLLTNVSVPLPWICRTRIAQDIVNGLGYLHKCQIIHRDLSSQNILIRVNMSRKSLSSRPWAQLLSRSPSTLSSAQSAVVSRMDDEDADKSAWLTVDQLTGYRRSMSVSPPSLCSGVGYPSTASVSWPSPLSSSLASATTDWTTATACQGLTCANRWLHKVTPLTADCGNVNCSSAEPLGGDNSLIADAYTAFVGDLGLCLDLRQKNADRTITAGNPYCTAPECLTKKAPYTPAADIFSFGLLLCEIITRVINDGLRIPRTATFGLDVDKLPAPPDCPCWLLNLAIRCCNVNHLCRPSIAEISEVLCLGRSCLSSTNCQSSSDSSSHTMLSTGKPESSSSERSALRVSGLQVRNRLFPSFPDRLASVVSTVCISQPSSSLCAVDSSSAFCSSGADVVRPQSTPTFSGLNSLSPNTSSLPMVSPSTTISVMQAP